MTKELTMTINDINVNYVIELQEVHGLSTYEVYVLIKEALIQ
jgi:hypothetical protein